MNKQLSEVELFNPNTTEQQWLHLIHADSRMLTFSKETYRGVCRVAWIDWLVCKRASSEMSALCMVYEHKKHNWN